MDAAQHTNLVDYRSLLGWLIPAVCMVGVFILGLLWKVTISRLDARLEQMDTHFNDRQKNLIAHFEQITTAIGVRQNATDDRLTLMQKDFHDKHIALLQSQAQCKLDHQREQISRHEWEELRGWVRDIQTDVRRIDASVTEHHAKYHNGLHSPKREG